VSSVYSIRIPKELKEALEGLEDVDWQRELRAYLELKVREEYAKKKLDEARLLRKKMKRTIDSAKLIREDRDSVR
jgi:glutamine synthetase